ncbi:hypothetical protein [Ottowia thiooxydans]|uniref:Citrate synthase (unknown stereospecificity) n=1 Tax=Ottowia thiooxydans TaxID=219182 RepID=A0ABV2Q6T7_9BURK
MILLLQDQGALPESDLFLLMHENAVRQSVHSHALGTIASAAAGLLGAPTRWM